MSHFVSASRLGRALAYTAYSLLVSLLILATFEAGLRTWGTSHAPGEVGRPPWMDDEAYELFRSWSEAADIGDLEGTFEHLQWDGRLRWTLRPELNALLTNVFLDPALGRAARWQMETNSRGFRSPEFSLAKPDGTARVVLVGDSNTMGWLLDDEQVYGRVLERHLADALGQPVEVINLGVSGYTTFGCRLIAEEIALPLDPDVLVVSCGSNDAQPMASSDADYARAHDGSWGRVKHELSQLRILGWIRSLRPTPPHRLVQRVDEAVFEGNVIRILGQANKARVPTVFLRACCCDARRNFRLDRAARRFGTPQLTFGQALDAFSDPEVSRRHADLLARIEGWYEEDELRESPHLRFYFRDRCHLNALGTELVGAALADTIAPRLRLDEGRPPKSR